MPTKTVCWIIWLLYLGFIIYGSLLPFDFHFLSYREAIEAFRHIPYLKLGMHAREDWIANIVLYIPLAFLQCVLFNPKGRYLFAKLLAVFLFCSAVALLVEFLQIYFPGRTVSQNDIIAEIAGTVIGIIVYVVFGGVLKTLVSKIIFDRVAAIRSFLVLYAVCYGLYCFFPYDFILSIEELSAKLQNGNLSLWVANTDGKASSTSLLKACFEIVTILPLGVAFALFAPKRVTFARSVKIGITIGLAIEGIQLFLVSGVSQGLSVLLKAIGFVLGWRVAMHWHFAYIQKILKLFRMKGIMLFGWLLVFLLLIYANWIGRGTVQPISEVSTKLGELSLLPFYYHYYASESIALASALLYFALYLPVGFMLSLKSLVQNKKQGRHHFLKIIMIAGLLSFFFETGKLFLSLSRPDITNILISIFSALCSALAMIWLQENIFQNRNSAEMGTI